MMKSIKKYISRQFDRFYRQRRLRLILDIALIAVIIGLIVAVLSLHFYRPSLDFNNWLRPEKPVVDLNNPPLELDFELNKTSIELEEGINLNLNLKNNSLVQIDNLKLSFILQTDNFSINKIELAKEHGPSSVLEDEVSIKGGDIILKKLEPGAEREASFKVYFRQKNQSSRTISWRLDSEYLVMRQIFKKSLLFSDLIVAALPKISATVYYNSPQGDQLGSGPLPPLVGLPTNFWIFLNAEAGSSFSDLVLSTRLAKNVELTDSSSLLAGSLNYSSSARQVVWQLNKIEANKSNYRAAFEVQLIPSVDQINSFANLLENIKFQAKDEVSGLLVSGFLNNLDTSLKDDLINRGEGRVSSFESLSEIIE